MELSQLKLPMDSELWSKLPMDMVYEILEFSNQAKLRNLRLMYRLEDFRLQLQVPPIKKNRVILQIPNEKKLEINHTCNKIIYCMFKIKNNTPYISHFYS